MGFCGLNLGALGEIFLEWVFLWGGGGLLGVEFFGEFAGVWEFLFFGEFGGFEFLGVEFFLGCGDGWGFWAEFGGFCHFEPFAKRRKIHKWGFWRFCLGCAWGFGFFWAEFVGFCHFKRSEKSKEFETRFKF